ncbi:MAG: MerR family transcriptional regulator [Lawsonibacter sp.]
MKINEVEAQVGITKKNIRFYEEQGLLSPSRNSENSYRDYGPKEVAALRQIKLLRKLGLPLEEIRRMQGGGSTVADGMRRHLVTLEREQRNLEQSVELCQKLKNREERLEYLDAGALLEEMERMEREGTTFKDKQMGDTRRIRYVAPIVVTILMTVLMVGIIALMVWAFTMDPAEAPPMPLMALFIAIPAVVILGVLLALYQRLNEIRKGEEDDAKDY